jgi:hypothetical protein
MADVAYFARYDIDGLPAALLRFIDSERIEYLKADGSWVPSGTSVEQLYDAALDRVDCHRG